MYKVICFQQHKPTIFKHIWKNATMLRYKVFAWLLIHDRINTRNLLKRKKFHRPSHNCVLCNAKPEETSQHLFRECDFALDCWSSITNRQRSFNTMEEMDNMIKNLPVGIAWEIVIMGCWNI